MSVPTSLRLSPDVLRRCHERSAGRHLARVGVFVLIYLGSAAGAITVATQATTLWPFILNLPLYLLAAASLHGMSLFTHEAVHGTLMENRLLNAVWGSLCALPVLQNFSAYRVLHLGHHQHLGEEGDPDHYANYTRWSWLVFCMNWLRLLLGYPVYIAAIPFLGFKQGTTHDRIGIMMELLATLLLGGLALSLIPTMWLLHGWLIPMLFINTMVNIRGMSQHTLLEQASDAVHGTRTILTRSWVRFFMCNENYHLEHHLYPGVPWHHLPEIHSALEPELSRQGAPYIASYGSFVKEFIIHSIRRSPWGWRSSRKPAE